jgi:CheY-like chemotaxis protein
MLANRCRNTSIRRSKEVPVDHDVGPGLRPRSRILVVDDNRDTADSMAVLLRIHGHEVQVVYDGPEAIAMAHCQPPEFILLDLGIPGMDGYQVARSLKHHGACNSAVIIAISGYGTLEDRDRSREAGIDHHLLKPVDIGALLALLTQSNGVAS